MSLRENFHVVCGFLAVHLAFLLNVIGLGTPKWAWRCTSSHVNGSWDGCNSTSVNWASQGLWMICYNDTCFSFGSEGNCPGWLRCLQVIYTSSSLGTFLVLVLFYWFYLTMAPWPVAYKMLKMILGTIMISSVLIAIAAIMFGIKSLQGVIANFEDKQSRELASGEKFIGWTYYVVIAACCVSLVITVQLVFAILSLRQQKPPYVDLT